MKIALDVLFTRKSQAKRYSVALRMLKMADAVSFRKNLIDLHTHGLGGFSTDTTDYWEILNMAELHAEAGVSAIMPTLYSGTIERMRMQMKAVRTAMDIQNERAVSKATTTGIRTQKLGKKSQKRHIASSTWKLKPDILGVHLEGPFLNPAQCGAMDKDTFVRPSISRLKKLIDGYEEIIKIITIAPEMPGALKVIERCASLGIRVNMGHSDATFQQAMRGKEAGASGISHIFNAMRPFHHRDPGLAGFGLMDDDVYVEVIADGFHLDRSTMKLIMKAKLPERIILVSDTVKESGWGKRAIYSESGLLAGGALTISDAIDYLVELDVSPRRVYAYASRNPLQYLGLIR